MKVAFAPQHGLFATALAVAGVVVACADPPPPVAPPPPAAATVAPLPPVSAPPPPPAPPPTGRVKATEFTIENGALKLPRTIDFDGTSDRLTPGSDVALLMVEDYLDAKPEVTLLRIEGHTDTDGNAGANQTLSEKRALTVARWLVGVGVKCERLIPVGFGGTRPTVPNDTPANKATNRRVTVAAAAVKGKPVNGMLVDGGGKVAGDPCR
jgi:OOP family OmpA-OmpF porin